MFIEPLKNPYSPSTSPILPAHQKVASQKKPVGNIPFPTPSVAKLRDTSSQPLDAALVHELQDLLGSQASHVERLMANLKERNEPTEISSINLEDSATLIEPPEGAIAAIQSGMDFLASVLPDFILENPSIQHQFMEIQNALEHTESLLSSLNLGFFQLSLIYKAKILGQTAKLLHEIKQVYKHENKPLPKAVRVWELQLHEQNKNLHESYLEMGRQVARQGISLAKMPLELFIEALPETREILLSILGMGGAALGTAFKAAELQKKEKISVVYRNWVKKFQKWQKKTQPSVDLSTRKWTGAIPSVSVRTQKVYTSLRDYRKEIENFLKGSKNIRSIRLHFKALNIDLPASIKTRKEFLKNWFHVSNFKKPILEQYATHQQLFLNLQFIAEKGQNLLEKREATAELKLMRLRSKYDSLIPKLQQLSQKPSFAKLIHEKLFPQFVQDFEQILSAAPRLTLQEMQDKYQQLGLHFPLHIQNAREAIHYLRHARDQAGEFSILFKQWMWVKPNDTILRAYIDHQETVTLTAKNALKEMVSKKHELEAKFISFGLFKAKASFYIAVAALVVTSLLGIAALTAFPLPGAVLLLFILKFSSLTTSVGFLSAGIFMMARYKRSRINPKNYFDQASLSLKKLYLGIKQYSYISSYKRLIETSQIVKHLQEKPEVSQENAEYQKALKQYLKTKNEFEDNQRTIEKWKKKTENLSNHLKAKVWKDFSTYAQLTINQNQKAFDTMRALKKALKECDFSLLDADTRSFFEVQLGFNLKDVQIQLTHDSEAIQTALQNFFTLDEKTIGEFIERQNERAHKQTSSASSVTT